MFSKRQTQNTKRFIEILRKLMLHANIQSKVGFKYLGENGGWGEFYPSKYNIYSSVFFNNLKKIKLQLIIALYKLLLVELI